MNNVRRTLYDVIGVASSASQDAIDEACLRLSDECRADKSMDAKTAARLLAEVEAVRATLADPDKRAHYDAELSREVALEEKPLSTAKNDRKEEPSSKRGTFVALTIVAIVAIVLAAAAASRLIQNFPTAYLRAALTFNAPVTDLATIPSLRARVTDLTGTLNEQQRSALEQTFARFEARKGSQVAVLIVPSTKPETVEQYAVRVEETWKLGRKGVDDGVLLVVAKDDRRLRIEVGYGLEGILPDAVAKRIVDQDIAPRFKAGDFYGGLREGTDRILRVIEGDALPPSRSQLASGAKEESGLSLNELGSFFSLMVTLFITDNQTSFELGLGVLLIALVALTLKVQKILGNFPGSIAIGALAGFATWLIAGSLSASVLWGVVVFCACLAIHVLSLSRDFDSDWGLLSSGGESGSGDFGGGGGSSGGGGASGSW